MRKNSLCRLNNSLEESHAMQHFLNLDKCSCGAYRYLAIREHKRSYEIYLIHHAHSRGSQDSRKYMKLASISKYKLNIHDERINDISQKKIVSLTFEQSIALRSLLKELDIGEDAIAHEEEELPEVSQKVIAQ